MAGAKWKTMTVNQLSKLIDKLKSDGHGRRPVCIDKDSFSHNCESDGVTILEVMSVGIERIRIADGDGGSATNKDGSERSQSTCILAGSKRSRFGFELIPLEAE